MARIKTACLDVFETKSPFFIELPRTGISWKEVLGNKDHLVNKVILLHIKGGQQKNYFLGWQRK